MVRFFFSTIRDLKFFYRYRQLIQELVVRELKARYRGSVLGFLWSFLHPLLLLLVYYTVFTVINRFAMDHYALFLFTGLLPWTWFNSSILEGSNSIIGGGSYVTKALFPPEILPVVTILSNLIHFLLSLPILIAFIFLWKIEISYLVFYLPVLLIIQIFFTMGLVFITSTISVFFRDTQQIIGHLTTFWFFLSPIIYPLQQIPQEYHRYYTFNPMTYLMQSYQNLFYHNRGLDWQPLGILFLVSVALFVLGYAIFVHYKDEFAELT